MHGRTLLLALSTSLITAATLAAPALADETLGQDAPAAVDGVVTSWQLQTGTPQNDVRLRSTQALMGSTATTATSDPVDGTTQTVAARLPIAAGGRLALVGASGSPTVAATVEPDRDGDQYGDSTQDGCPDDHGDHVAPCDGTRTVGSPLTLQPDPRGFSGSGHPLQAIQQSAAGTVAAVPADGTLVRWRLRAAPSAGATMLEVVRPDGDGTSFTVIAESGPFLVNDTGVLQIDAGLSVQAGDRLAARSVAANGSADLGAIAYRAADQLGTHQPPAATGQSFTPDGAPAGYRLLVQADIAPPGGADLALTGSGGGTFPATTPLVQTYTVTNAGPETATAVKLAIRGATLPPVAPPAGVTCVAPPGAVVPDGADCTIDRLAPGASLALTPAWALPTLYPPASGTFTTSANVGAATPDPDLTNNDAVVTTVLTPVALGPPRVTPPVGPPPPLAPCANVVRGTRDDDVVRGTAFPDRLVGGDGDDLLKGLGADDCLEGGAGDDVLDGGDGNDRLSGASGSDRLIGGRGDDKLTAGNGNDRLSGGAGNDRLSPGAGRDAVDAGAGNDTINSVDGVRETIDCGAGRDTARADRRDVLKHCEKVTRKR